MAVYYNEFDLDAAEWLKKLIKNNLLPGGDVDTRSIVDVRSDDLRGYEQCHFFAGIGGWALALQQAGWGERPVWTGSLPCQPFSGAGNGKGFNDERHLWGCFFNLIQECKPDTIFGEQVSSKIALEWLDVVQTDLESENYSVGTVDLCAASVGSPHIRQRLYWVANSECERWCGWCNGHNESETGRIITETQVTGSMSPSRMANTETWGWRKEQSNPSRLLERANTTEYETGGFSTNCTIDRMGNTTGNGCEQRRETTSVALQRECTERTGEYTQPQFTRELSWGVEGLGSVNKLLHSRGNTTPTNGFWQNADWLRCRDERWRPIEPGIKPLANGVSNRLVKLRGYGNAIVVPLAKTFIESYMEIKNYACS